MAKTKAPQMDKQEENWFLAQMTLERAKPILDTLGLTKKALDDTNRNVGSDDALKFYLLDCDTQNNIPRPNFGSKALYKYMNWKPGHVSSVLNDATLLGPRDIAWHEQVNGMEIARVEKYFKTKPSERPKSLVTFTIGERMMSKNSRWTERFWVLNRYFSVHVVSTEMCLVAVQPLAGSMPSQLQEYTDQSIFDEFCLKLGIFLDKIYRQIDQLVNDNTISHKQLVDRVEADLKDWVLKYSGDYLFDHYVPKNGGQTVNDFEMMGGWTKVLEQIEDQLSSYWQFDRDLVETFKTDDPRDVACAVADPTYQDCPLTFVSRGFEELTGYPREYSLGRNCRFLQPNDAWRNDNLNLSERKRMKIFCEAARTKMQLDRDDTSQASADVDMEAITDAIKGKKIVTLLINESEQGFPFLNLLVMEYVKLKDGKLFIFGLQTNWMLEPRLMADICIGDSYSMKKLKHLREVLKAQEDNSNTLKDLAKVAFTQWIIDLTPQPKQPLGPRVLPGADRFPWFGLEISNMFSHEETIHLVHTALQQGVRHLHFYINCTDKSTLISARSALTLKIMTLFKTLGYLRDSEAFTFSMRTRVEAEEFFHEVYRTLRMWNFKIRYWLLDVRGATPEELQACWKRMSETQSWGQVDHLGLYHGGQREFDLIEKMGEDVGKVAVHALELFPMMPVEHGHAKFMQKLRKLKVAVCAVNIFGPKEKPINEKDEVLDFAQKYNMDPLLLLVKWAREMMFSTIVPLTPVWNRLSWAFNQNPPKRKDLWEPCPPDFVERFLNARMSITELFDDQLPIIMKGTWKEDLRKKSNAALSFRRNTMSDIAHLMTEKTMNTVLNERNSNDFDDDENVPFPNPGSTPSASAATGRRASVPVGIHARRASASGALPDVNANISNMSKRAELRAEDYMSRESVGSVTSDAAGLKKRRYPRRGSTPGMATYRYTDTSQDFGRRKSTPACEDYLSRGSEASVTSVGRRMSRLSQIVLEATPNMVENTLVPSPPVSPKTPTSPKGNKPMTPTPRTKQMTPSPKEAAKQRAQSSSSSSSDDSIHPLASLARRNSVGRPASCDQAADNNINITNKRILGMKPRDSTDSKLELKASDRQSQTPNPRRYSVESFSSMGAGKSILKRSSVGAMSEFYSTPNPGNMPAMSRAARRVSIDSIKPEAEDRENQKGPNFLERRLSSRLSNHSGRFGNNNNSINYEPSDFDSRTSQQSYYSVGGQSMFDEDNMDPEDYRDSFQLVITKPQNAVTLGVTEKPDPNQFIKNKSSTDAENDDVVIFEKPSRQSFVASRISQASASSSKAYPD